MKLLAFLLIAVAMICVQCTTKQSVEKPPLAPEKPVVDTYFGTELTDDYRYFEDSEDTIAQTWYKVQSEYAKEVLGSISGRQTLLDKMYEFDGRRANMIYSLSITDNDKYFYLKSTPDDETGKLYYRDGFEGEERLLFDPESFEDDPNTKYVINSIMPTEDAKYVAVSITPNGKELATSFIIDMETDEILPDRIEKMLGITSWLPDLNSFLYVQAGSDNVQDMAYYSKAKTLTHVLNTDASADKVFFSKEKYPELNLGEMDIAVAAYDRDCKKIFSLAANVDNRLRVFYAPVSELNAPKVAWKTLFEREDEIYDWYTNSTHMYLYTPKDAPNFKLLKIPVNDPDLSKAEIFVAEDPSQKLSGYTLTKDGVYYTMKKNGVEEKAFFKSFGDNSIKELNLPFAAGTVRLSSKGVQFSDAWLSLSGWTRNNKRYRYDLANDAYTFEMLSDMPEFPEYEDLVVEELMVKSHDGVEVPLSVIYKEGLQQDGKNRLLLFGYGAYGMSMDPGFSPNVLQWCLEDGIYAVAHIRGGGELGDQWYKGGHKTTKPNTWKDFIACAEYMIDNKYTSAEKIAIYGGSAGGILIGRSMTERPDLFAAVIPAVGVMNTVRAENSPNGPGNIPEFGTVKDSVEFFALLEMDSYHHLKEGVVYPPTLLTAGMNDPRVIVWNPGKFAARLQAINQANNPVIFRVDYEAGHGIDNTKSRNFEELADILSFALWNTGSERYKPEK
ncbi:prolyl oligopeptidase family serine peptidase [uncultured Draconibacterium sp.]|uniref:prolyl oligopeptidase family serine peptidase n=1 Tax=uncultured Draconibacterium sp. TaxID=1573823 RepID=UPI002623578C|nr:prolyl oligopeptidase family serine peptidase [uncultured Draconibacterium sp.]